MAQPFAERSSFGNKGDVSFAYRHYKPENRWSAKDAILARKKFSRANRFVGRTDASGCPPRTIVLWSLLRQRGIATDVRIGARGNSQGEFQAHAWLEWNGEVLNDVADVGRQYRPFNRSAFDRVEMQSSCGSE